MSASASAPAPLAGGRLVLAAILLGLANFMVVLDLSIANVSVPHIAGALAASPSQAVWVVTSYSIAEAITVPLTGWLAARFGSVRTFTMAVAGFGVCSLLCGLSPSLGLLIAARIAQGLCGGPIMPLSQTLLVQIFPKERSAQALGIWSVTTVVAPILGPIVGGSITDNTIWNWIFLINIPFAVGVFMFAPGMLRSHETAVRRDPVDFVGFFLLAGWVAPMQVMLDRGRELDWFASPFIAALAAVAGVGFCVFVWWELRRDKPIVDLGVFRYRGFSAGALALTLTFAAYFGGNITSALWLQTSMGYTATWAGLSIIGFGFAAVAAAPMVSRLIARTDARILISFGILLMGTMALWRGGFATNVNFTRIAIPQVGLGFALPFFYLPVTGLMLAAVRPEETAGAAGIANFLRTVSSAFGTATMTTFWENQTTVAHGQLVATMNYPDAAADAAAGQGFSLDGAHAYLDAAISQQAAMLATNATNQAVVVVFVVAGLAIWLAPKTLGAAAARE